ncbi:hypothetical protein ACQP1G_20170 [Nocardia sp. CA-107356]|uniref:hypothetical protein n=1 Tax=Nocardia sp. CA-107356 TaxID=3239972 RepID=UPI003D93FCE8
MTGAFEDLVGAEGRRVENVGQTVREVANGLKEADAAADRAVASNRELLSAADISGAYDPVRLASVRNLPPLDQLELIPQGGGTGNNYLVLHNDQEIGIYKSRSDGNRIRNEVSAWEADRMLGLDVVPYTRNWLGPYGPGSLQEYVPYNGHAFDYESVSGQKMATYDYVMASGDRHLRNALNRAAAPGMIAAIDNESILPEPGPRNMVVMRSTFVARNLNKPLDVDLVAHLNSVDPDRFGERLQFLGHSTAAAEWAARRLMEVQRGQIAGDAWRCVILDGLQLVYPPGYANIVEYALNPPA